MVDKPDKDIYDVEYVDFEQYVNENYYNRIQILNRETFHQITRPIVIFFNHFREKCAYLTKWLDRIYELALKYGDSIEFIAANLFDLDIINQGINPINLFCSITRPEDETPQTYAIDEKKRIHKHYDTYQNQDYLCELCENLLKGSLFPSQPLPENNDTNLVKICVHLNYEELVLKSTKNIFLIINFERLQHLEPPNYENVALALKDYNLDIVFMEAEKNYIPFDYPANFSPTILFIPCNDKNNFIYYEDVKEEQAIITFLQNVLEQPELLLLKQRELKSKMLKKAVEVASDFQIDFHDLTHFLPEHYNNCLNVLDRQMLDISNKTYCNIIMFMDFPNMKCLPHHIPWLDKLYQVAEKSYNIQFFIADFKDIDVINSKWKAEDLINSSLGMPKIYGYDFLKHTYEFGNFDSLTALYYFTVSLQTRQLCYSQRYSRTNLHQMVKEWTADYFNIFLQNTKKHNFITFYSSNNEHNEKLFNLLDLIAVDVKNLNVEVVKFDAELNYVDLEYAQASYPVHYFIPKHNKRDTRLYICECALSRYKILEFIKSNLGNN